MKIATSPGQRIDCGRSKQLPEPEPKTLAESVAATKDDTPELAWDPSTIRGAADRLRALVEKRGA